MKKTAIILMMLFCVTRVTTAQKGKVRQANSFYKSGKLDKAKETIDQAINDEKCINWDNAYLIKGQIYQALFESPMDAYKALSPNALNVAWEAYQKAVELDTKGRYKKEIVFQCTNLIIHYTNKGVDAYNSKDFKGAFLNFEKVLNIRESKVMAETPEAKIDTVVMFNAGVAAQQAQMYAQAEKYYKEILKYDYEPAKTYSMLYTVLKEQGKTEEAMEYLKKGYESYPENAYLLVELINYYLLGDKPENAEKYLDAAIAQDPNNSSFYRAKGTLYEKIGKNDEAQKMYEKALSIDPNDFYAQYGIANFKLTAVVELHKKVNEIEEVKKFNAEMEKVYAGYEEVLPYFEKARQLKPDDTATLSTLRELYFKLRVKKPEYEAKYKEMDALLKKR